MKNVKVCTYETLLSPDGHCHFHTKQRNVAFPLKFKIEIYQVGSL